MCKAFYKLIITTSDVKVNLFDMLDLADKYGKINQNYQTVIMEDENPELTNPMTGIFHFKNDEWITEPLFVRANLNTVCAFYNNLMITYAWDKEKDDKVVRVYMKKPEDWWTFIRKDGGDYGIDLLNPYNVHAEVYTDYSISILNLERSVGWNYKSGTWNKRFHREIKEFVKKVNAYTELNQIETAYSGGRSKNK